MDLHLISHLHHLWESEGEEARIHPAFWEGTSPYALQGLKGPLDWLVHEGLAV